MTGSTDRRDRWPIYDEYRCSLFVRKSLYITYYINYIGSIPPIRIYFRILDEILQNLSPYADLIYLIHLFYDYICSQDRS